MKRKMMSIVVGGALLSLALGTTQVQAQAGKISGDAVKIGVLTDMSGGYSDLGGQGSVTAAQMAIADFGARRRKASSMAARRSSTSGLGFSLRFGWRTSGG